MKEIIRLIHTRAAALARNPLFTQWLENDAIPLSDKFIFSPMAIDFVMGFRDFNRYFVSYPSPQNALEEALNTHAREDETHSALFLQDWSQLGMDERLSWAPGELYWWQTCEQMEDSRRVDFELARLVWHHPDPLVRFAIIESMEAAGTVFFKRTAPLAAELGARTATALPYFGHYHLERETGHLQHADERPFYEAPLSPTQREAARRGVEEVFKIFEFHFTAWERLARAIHEGRWGYRPSVAGQERARLWPVRPPNVSAFMSLEYPRDLAGAGAELSRLRLQCVQELFQTDFCAWIRAAPVGDYRRVAGQVMLQWVVDNWACADYFTFDTTYPEPKSPLERGINRLSTLYASEMNRRYVEWNILGIDEATGWKGVEALYHYWLDERIQPMRAIFADLRKLTFRYPKPLHRYWILKCFVRFGDALVNSLGVALRNSGEPEENFPGLAGCPERMHPDLPLDPEADEAIAQLERQPLEPEDMEILRTIIVELKAQEARRLAAGWRFVQTDRHHDVKMKALA